MEAIPSDPERIKDVANALFNERRYVEALRMYDRALRIDPSYLPVITNKAMTLLKLDLADEAYFTVVKGLTVHPGDERLGKLKEKCDETMKGLTDPAFFHGKGEYLFRLGKFDDALLA
ncbi:MAG: hypothetical protein L0Z54_00325, partial [Thermoplasmata archaeon]|nr:hypothetical protein [Thermoplasmata archaeon]